MKATVQKSTSKREDKKQVNIQWNSPLFFQIGIILSLFLVFWIMQTSFDGTPIHQADLTDHSIMEPAMIDYVVDVPRPQPIAPIVKKMETRIKKTSSSTVEVVQNTSMESETPIPPSEAPATITPEPTPVPVSETPSNEGPKSIINVEFVPVYPGCEAMPSNSQKIDCMSAKINAFINKNFRRETLENLAPNQTHKVYVQFKIDTRGYITDVRANSTDERLKKEAQRVIGHLPEMKPGRQGDKNVEVLYTVPITFRIQ